MISTKEKPQDIKERTFAFALEIIKFAQSIDFRNEALRTLVRWGEGDRAEWIHLSHPRAPKESLELKLNWVGSGDAGGGQEANAPIGAIIVSTKNNRHHR